MTVQLSYLSICSGLGGAALALDPLGFREVANAEIEPFCAALLNHRYGSGRPWRMPEPDAEGLTDDERRERRAAIRAVENLEPTALGGNAPPNLGDFTQIEPSELPPVDMLIGGTPCQAFSFAGLRRGLADARGNLTLAFVELAHGLAETNGTRCALWENVPGVLSDDDNAFGCFLGAFVGADDALLPCPRPPAGKSNDLWRWRPAGRYPVLDDDGEPTGEIVEREAKHIPKWPRAGMASGPRARAAWIVRNAQYFGVPQRRERVFLVVDLGGGPDPAAVLFERRGMRGNSGARGKVRKDVARSLGACTAGGGQRTTDLDGNGALIPEPVYLGNAEGGAEEAPFLTASNLGKTVNNQTPLVGEPVMFKPSHYTRDKDGAPATVAPPTVAQEWAVRRLLPVECERLQGVPDGHTDIPWRGKGHAPDGPRYRAIGNGWATPVVRWIGERIAENWPKD